MTAAPTAAALAAGTAPGPWALELALVAFAGGAFGAAIGALPSFALTGAVVVAGELLALARGATGAGPPPELTAAVGFGPVLGPHVAFAGGAAALAYGVRYDRLDAGVGGDGAYHPAKDVERGLGTAPDVLAVGGVFGVAGHWMATAAGAVGVPTDPVALAVVGSAVLHRAVFGYDLLGRPPAGSGWLDLSPYRAWATDGGNDGAGADADDGTPGRDAGADAPDRDSGDGATRDADARANRDADGARANRDADGTRDGTGDGAADGRPPVEPWLPHQSRPAGVAVLGAVVGALGAYVAYLTASPFLAFGASAASLGLLAAGVGAVPVTHHVTLPASTVVLALADPATGAGGPTPAAVAAGVGLPTALAAGAVAGLGGALAGEFLARLAYAHADTHLDPPAASIVLTTLAVALLATAGLLPSAAWVPTP